MKPQWSLALVLLIGSAFAAEPGIEFSGVLGSGRETQVSLTNPANGQSQWVAVGRSFAGYTVVRYDANEDVVVLARDGREFRVPLKKGKVRAGNVEPPPEIKGRILNYLRQLCAAADQFYLENGKSTTTYEQLVGTDKYVKSVTPVAGENYRAIEFAQGKPLRVTTADGYTMSYEP